MFCLFRTLGLDLQWAVIIAMAAMRMMQMAFYQVVGMVAVRHPFMAAIRTMNVPFIVAGAVMVSRASVGVRCVHFEHVLIDMIAVHVVQVPVMQVIDVPVMADRLMPAVWSVLVSVVSMRLAVVHQNSSVGDVHVPQTRRAGSAVFLTSWYCIPGEAQDGL
jgi:hypothetical protein